MRKTLIALGASTLLLAACGQSETDTTDANGPVVSGPEAPLNPAIDTEDTAANTTLTPGASSFTSGQAREAIEGAGYTDVGELSQDDQGIWSATATRNGAQATVAVDYQGVVTTR